MLQLKLVVLGSSHFSHSGANACRPGYRWRVNELVVRLCLGLALDFTLDEILPGVIYELNAVESSSPHLVILKFYYINITVADSRVYFPCLWPSRGTSDGHGLIVDRRANESSTKCCLSYCSLR